MIRFLLAVSLLVISRVCSGQTLLITEAATSAEYQKYLAVGVEVPLQGTSGPVIRSMTGTFNRTNMFDVAYTGFVEASVGYRMIVGPVYFSASQGVTHLFGSTNTLFDTSYQLPTSVSLGLTDGKRFMGLFFKHYSNAQVRQRWTWEGIGLFIGNQLD